MDFSFIKLVYKLQSILQLLNLAMLSHSEVNVMVSEFI